jgi:hypothetical protein
MVVGTGRPVRRGEEDELLSRRFLFGGSRRLRRSSFGGGNFGSLLLRIRSLFEVVVVASNLVLILVSQTS